jgi:hypothetical protein
VGRARSFGPHPLLLLLTFVTLVWSGCAGRRFVVPSGPAVPAPDAASAWTAATGACRDVRAASAQFNLSARAGSCRIPRVRVGLAIDGGRALALVAQVGGTAVFRLGGPADQATLVLSDGPRTLRAPAVDIVEALVGVRLDPARLLAVLTGCLTPRPDFERGARRNGLLEVTAGDSVAYLEHANDQGWRLRAGVFDGLQVHYPRLGPTAPRAIEIRSEASGSRPAIAITISALEVGTAAPAQAIFAPPDTAGAAPMTVEELRATCPTGGPRN